MRKSEYPKITVRPSEKLRQQFRRKCFNSGLTQDCVMIELMNIWVKGKIAVPPEGVSNGNK